MKNIILLNYSILLLGILFSCTPRNFLKITPNSRQVGETVFISKNQGTFSPEAKIEVSIAEMNATVIGVTDDGVLQVLVPKAKEGSATVSVSENGQHAGNAQLTILGSSAEQLLLELSPEGELKLIRKKDDSGGLEYQFATGEVQLNYDLIGADDNVIYSGSIAHPQKAGVEIFEDPEGTNIHREVPKRAVVFPIRIPKLQEAVSVRFYEAEAGTDLTTRDGRSKRVFISEINLR